jgi:hypothetical protein
MEALAQKKVTLYIRGEFMGNFHKVEATAYKVDLVPYAQYVEAVRFTYKGKRQRLLREGVQTFRPSLVVLEGWGHVDPPSMWGKTETLTDGTIVAHGAHSGCSEGWQHDFDALLADYVVKSGAKVLHDYRNHKPGMR